MTVDIHLFQTMLSMVCCLLHFKTEMHCGSSLHKVNNTLANIPATYCFETDRILPWIMKEDNLLVF
jgi:hypothetical protein